jgi:hypothetical protein
VVPLIAQWFASPWLLWGLGLASAPIIIHLLHRRQYREVPWAAMKFLLEAVRKNSRRLRIEQLILLAVRTLILVLIVMALAEPMLKQIGPLAAPRQPAHRILVIDASVSMGTLHAENTLFERAKAAARAIVARARQGDAFQLARLSNLPPAVLIATPAYQPDEVIREIDQLQLPHGRPGLPGSLEQAADLLKLAPELKRKEVYLISDFQRTSWTMETTEEVARMRTLLRRCAEAGRLVLVDLGDPDAENAAITGFELLDRFPTSAKAARFRVTMRNFGSMPVTGRAIEFLADDRLLEQRQVDVGPGAESVEEFLHAFPRAGEHRVEVRLAADRAAFDDQRYLAVPVRDQIQVLCVDGRGGAGRSGSATDFLALALAPASAGATRQLVNATVIGDGAFAGTDLGKYDCIFFCNVRTFTQREAESVKAFLEAGGGVVWCLGDQPQADNYNRVLYADGKGVLPARLLDRRGNAEQREEAFRFSPGDGTHPLLKAFEGNPNTGLETTLSYAYVGTASEEQPASRVALWFDDGGAAILERPFGRGRSLLVTTSVDDRWGVWPLWPSFVPLMHEIVDFAISGRWQDREVTVGQPLELMLPPMAADVEASVGRPDGQSRAVSVSREADLVHFRFDDTSLSGIYEARFGHPLARTDHFAANVDTRESNLAKYSREEIAQELLPGVEFAYTADAASEEAATDLAAAPAESSAARWLIYAAVYLLFAEQLLAWDFRRGLWWLCPVLPLADWLRNQRRAR